MGTRDSADVRQLLTRIGALIRGLEQSGEPGQGPARELVQTVLELHGAGLERMLELIYDSNRFGQGLIDELGRDDLVGNLLLLHGLHPLGLEERVLLALERVRPKLALHGGGARLLGVTTDGVVRLALEGNCHGCASSRVTLRYAVEEEIARTAPDVTGIEVEGAVDSDPAPGPCPVASPGFIPLTQVAAEAAPNGIA